MFMKHNENNKVDKIVLFHQALGKASQPRMNCHGTLQSTDYTMACRVTNNKGSRAPLDATVYVKSQLPTGKLREFLAATAKKGRIRKDRRCFSFPALGEAVAVPSKLRGSSLPRGEQKDAKPSRIPLFLHTRCRWEFASPAVPPIPSPLPQGASPPAQGKPGPLQEEDDSSPSVW